MKPNTAEEFNRIYAKFSKYFEEKQMYSLHNLLWQLIINGTWRNRTVVVHPVFPAEPQPWQYELAFVEKGGKGYFRMYTGFKPEITNYNKAVDVCEELTEEVFDIHGEEYDSIVARSMDLEVVEKKHFISREQGAKIRKQKRESNGK